MPKKEALPAIEDDTKFLVVHYPYPPLAQVAERIPDRIAMAKWIASCIGQNYVISFYSRKSSANKVIVEISKSCPKITSILGEHKWREFLHNCPPEDIERTSKVLYCRYSTTRAIKEQGWRYHPIEDSYFKLFNVAESPFVQPYPATSWCEVPESVHKDDSICRPLPAEVFGRLKRDPNMLIVPGSNAYFSSKASDIQSNASPTRATTVPSSNPVSSTSDSSTNSSKSGISPVLMPPPGLERRTTDRMPSPSEDSESEEQEFPKIAEVTVDLAMATINASDVCVADNGNTKGEEEGSYWASGADRPDTWDKPQCPEHQWSCRRGICKVLDRMYREREKKARQMNSNQEGQWESGQHDKDGFQQVPARGGRGRGRGRGLNNNGWRGQGWRGSTRARGWP